MHRQQDIISGMALIGLAGFFLFALSRIPHTSYQTIAPDLFPRLCTYGLLLGGVVLCIRGYLRGSAKVDIPRIRSILVVIAGVIAFGVLAPKTGYAPAGLATILISGLGSPQQRMGQLIVFALVVIAISICLFTFVLKLTVPALVLPGFRL